MDGFTLPPFHPHTSYHILHWQRRCSYPSSNVIILNHDVVIKSDTITVTEGTASLTDNAETVFQEE
jgi:hypothetical protein